MGKESKLEQKAKKESNIIPILKGCGTIYAIFLGIPTVGALAGLAYSLYSGDQHMLKDIGFGAVMGGCAEVIGGFLYGIISSTGPNGPVGLE